MGKFLCVFLAFALNVTSVYIYRTPKKLCNMPFFSYLFFLIFTALFLYDRDIKPFPCSNCVIEFLVAAFLMETIMNDFWLPLQRSFNYFLLHMSDILSVFLWSFGFRCTSLCQFTDVFKSPGAQIFANYALSMCFLLCGLRATAKRMQGGCDCSPSLGEVIAKQLQIVISNYLCPPKPPRIGCTSKNCKFRTESSICECSKCKKESRNGDCATRNLFIMKEE